MYCYICVKGKLQYAELLEQESLNFRNCLFVQILVWDTRRAALCITLDLHSDVIYSLSFNRDGSRIVTTSRDKRLRIIDPRSGKLLQVSISHILYKTYLLQQVLISFY